MTLINSLYRPAPDSLHLEEIPEWDLSLIGILGKQMVVRLAYDPKGEMPPEVLDLAGCDPSSCDKLSEKALKELWQIYSSKGVGFDGVYKRANPFGSFDYYFYRHKSNDFDEMVCKGFLDELPVSLTRTEGIVLELWTSLRSDNFQACDVAAENGEYRYYIDIRDENWKKKLRKETRNLEKALEWKRDNPEKPDNPWNPHRHSLDISLEKIEEIRSSMGRQIWKERGFIMGGALLALASPFWIGVGFRYGPDLFKMAVAAFSRGPKLIPLFFFPGQETLLYPEQEGSEYL